MADKPNNAHTAIDHIVRSIAHQVDPKSIDIVNVKGDSAEMLYDMDLKIDGQAFNVSVTVTKI